MKILHSALIKDVNSASGILNQMYDEKVASENLENLIEVKVFTSTSISSNKYDGLIINSGRKFKGKINEWLGLRLDYYNWLISQEISFDCFILRHTPYDPLQAYFIRKTRKPVFLVHHTKELDELKLINKKGYILYLIENFFGNLSIKWSKGVIGVTDEIIQYEKNRVKDSNKIGILYPNGIRYSCEELIDVPKEKINIVFIASYFFDWHGLDLLLDSTEKNKDKDFVLHLIGDIPGCYLDRISLDERIKFYGKLDKESVIKVISKCSVGLGSFALYRKELNEACTLKVREYLYYGLPVYSGHLDIFPNNFEYYRYGDCDIIKIIDFSNEMKNKKRKDISFAARQYIDKTKLLNNLINHLKVVLNVK